MQLLIDHGTPINAKGIHGWTALHSVSVSEDIEALEILVRNGADLTIKTDIDDYATPPQEAQSLHKMKSIEYFRSVLQSFMFSRQVLADSNNCFRCPA